MWWTDGEIVKRFEDKIESRPIDACWMWIGGKMPNGYGSFSVRGQTRYAHRLVLERKLNRELMPGEQALHSCDTPACVNPDHLRSGDHADNMQDKIDRNRFTRTPGEKHGMHKLTADQVRQIRASESATQRVLAERYGVSQALISFIKNRKNWKHI